MVMSWYTDWRDFKVLPYDGEMDEQPAFVFEAIRFIHTEVNRAEMDRSKKQQAEAERKARKARARDGRR